YCPATPGAEAPTTHARSLRRVASIDHQFAARHELRLIGRKIQHPISDVVRFPQMTDRMQADQMTVLIRILAARYRFHHWRPDIARMHRVDSDSVTLPCTMQCRGLREDADPALARVVCGQVRVPYQTFD